MNFNPEKFNKIDIDKYKKETLNFQYKNNNLPWYFNAFIILENTFIIIFIVFLIILLISLSIYYI